MGTIKCGFWTTRFLVSPEEFSTWIDLFHKERFSFVRQNMQHDIKSDYNTFYQKRMDIFQCHPLIPSVCTTVIKDGFQSAFHLIVKAWRFYDKDGRPSQNDIFVELSTPTQYPVDSDDGIHFTYEDILQKEPLVKTYFDMFNGPIKDITKPLYQHGSPMYSVRISKRAYTDLLESAFYKSMCKGVTSKWKV